MDMAMDRVLVIDDEYGPRESLRFLLKEEYEVRCASSVDEGVNALREAAPDMVIMDIKMPKKNGIEGLGEIRAIDPDVSVIMLTGFGSLETAQQAIRFGANDYLKKPFDTTEMMEIVGRYVERTHAARTRTAAAEELKLLGSQMQSTIDEKDHLATLGQASSEFVHDLSNPISVIYGYVELMMSELEESGDLSTNSATEVVNCVNHIQNSVHRCRELLETWKSFGVKNEAQFEPVTIASVIAEVAASARPAAIAMGGRIEVEPGPADAATLGNSIQIFRAVQNLVSNAIQALPQRGGVVRLTWSRDNSSIVIRVIDNGSGIPSDRLDNVFEPYFTTKKESGGTGLGLYITRKVVAAHHGTIDLANNSNGDGGAVGTLTLPDVDAACSEIDRKVA